MSERRVVAVYEGAPVIVTRQLIRTYASAVENLNPVYYNERAAQEAGFASTIAPASFHAQYGTLRMAMGSSNWVPKGSLHTKQHFEFKRIVEADDYLYTTVEVVQYQDAKGRDYDEYKFTVKNQRDEVVCLGAMTNLVPPRK